MLLEGAGLAVSPGMNRLIRWCLVAIVGAQMLGCFPVPVPVWDDDDDDEHHHHRHDR